MNDERFGHIDHSFLYHMNRFLKDDYSQRLMTERLVFAVAN